MNVFTATILSTKKQALTFVSTFDNNGWRSFPAYALKVARNGDDDFALGIHRVTYPEGENGGTPQIAKEPHFNQQFTREELINFFEVSGFFADGNWQPIEDDMEGVKLL